VREFQTERISALLGAQILIQVRYADFEFIVEIFGTLWYFWFNI